jgi:protein-L-isoaspartate(D-aspartate) O-methyltransferase
VDLPAIGAGGRSVARAPHHLVRYPSRMTPPAPAGHADLRERLVATLERAGSIRTERVAAAFRAVPRHVFLPDVAPKAAYRDEAHVTRRGADGRPTSSSSQPAIMAVMLEQLGVEPGHAVLEIGAGTGYNAALLAELAGPDGSVVTVDLDADLVAGARARLAALGVANVTVAHGDGGFGWPPGAPYDRIVLTVGAADLAPAWIDQLAAAGRLVLPLSLRGAQRSIAFERAGQDLVSVSCRACGFMAMRGAFPGAGRVVALGDRPGLFAAFPDARARVDAAALGAALARPGRDVPTGVDVTATDLWDGVPLWVALHEPGVARLFALAGAADRAFVPPLVEVPSETFTLAVAGERSLAALALRDPDAEPFEPVARPFGPAGDALAGRLAACVRAWDAAGRPASEALRVTAALHPAPAPAGGDAAIALPHADLAVAWVS